MSTLQPPHQFLPSLQLKAESFLFCPLPLPVTGVETIQGAITYDGPMDPGFTGEKQQHSIHKYEYTNQITDNQTIGVDGNASIQSGLPIATYQAILSPTNFDNATGSVITGTITATTNANGTGVIFNVALAGVPNAAEYVPFVYHVHNLPISADYNCTTSMGHLDPTDRGEYYPCDDTQPKTCQAGDLGGKHGNITMAGTFQTSFLELYLRYVTTHSICTSILADFVY